MNRKSFILTPLSVVCLLAVWPQPAVAYIALPPTTLGHLLSCSTYITVAQVEEVHQERKAIVYRKVRDIKGTWPSDVVRHVFDPKPGDAKSRPVLDEAEWLYILQWAKKGRTAVLFCEPSRAMAHTYIDQGWYSSLAVNRDKDSWALWKVVTTIPELLCTYCCGTPAQLVAALDQMVAGKERSFRS